MVDFRNGASRTDDLAMMVKRLEAVEQKVEALSASMDARFDAVDEAFADQRRFTEFAFDTLAAKVDAGFAQVERRFLQVDAQFARIDGRLAQIDANFAQIDNRFAQMDSRFAQIDGRFTQMDGRFMRLEGKLDAFIDTQSKANALVERRLDSLERRRRGPAR